MTAEPCSEQDRGPAEARDEEIQDWHTNAWVDTDATDQEVAMSTPFLPSALAWQSIPSRSNNGSSLDPRSQNRFTLLCRAVGVWACLLSLGALMLLLIVHSSLPVFEEQDRDALRIPRNFQQLKALNDVLQNYSHTYFFRVLIAWTAIDLFLQTFSIPGSMYMSILAGAMWGMPFALPWVCMCIATGSTLCYLLSRYAGQVLLVFPSWDRRMQAWRSVVQQYDTHMLWYMSLLRMMPVPPDFMLNIMAPHLGVEIKLFWLSCFLGVISMTLIHTAIGEELSEMTSSDDFRFFSVKNMAIMLCIGAAIILPTLLKRYVQSPEDSLDQQGAIHLDTHVSPFRESIRNGFNKLIVKIDPRWAQRQNPQPMSDPNSDQDGSDSDLEHTSWPSTDWDESMTAWRQDADPTST
ncbi:hypothetical protein MPSI1_003169 [Malassezia psittaci]|uniref:VTT domain-containing protein n=1 Tax=Malassezia psittaci TaxID=1821823 RepID=A0AAF0FE25_9BASI|nr:hypothetical protein MPSI1_003169 [Malassezia psittaci]